MWIFDAHLDLSMNAMEWNRDLRQNVLDIRQSEQGKTDKPDRAQGTVAFPDMRRGHIGICVATQIARYVKPNNSLKGWHSPEQAWAHSQGQLAWYKAMEEDGQLVQITDSKTLNNHAAQWAKSPSHDAPIGYILSLEGADSIISPRRLERAYDYGLRVVGLSHYGPGTYAQGTAHDGGLGSKGGELLREMDRLGIILDATHLNDSSFWEAMDIFEGPVWASHSNCRALVPNDRQFCDDQIKYLIERGAVIGGVLDAWMLTPCWERGKSTPAESGVKLENVIDHMEHICELAGNANHVGIGTDLDGGYGREQSPEDLDTIADLQRLPDLLSKRGFDLGQITGIMHGNFMNFLNKAWA